MGPRARSPVPVKVVRRVRAHATCLLVALLLATGVGRCDGFGDVEARVIKPIAPDLTLAIGGGLSVLLGQVPSGVPILEGRTLFGDFVAVPGGIAGGASVSLRPAGNDDGLRLGVAIWRGENFRWSAYLARAVPFHW